MEINDQVIRIPVGHAAISNGSWSPTVLPTDLVHCWEEINTVAVPRCASLHLSHTGACTQHTYVHISTDTCLLPRNSRHAVNSRGFYEDSYQKGNRDETSQGAHGCAWGGKSSWELCQARAQKTSASPHLIWQGEGRIIQLLLPFQRTLGQHFQSDYATDLVLVRIVFLTRQERSKEINS